MSGRYWTRSLRTRWQSMGGAQRLYLSASRLIGASRVDRGTLDAWQRRLRWELGFGAKNGVRMASGGSRSKRGSRCAIGPRGKGHCKRTSDRTLSMIYVPSRRSCNLISGAVFGSKYVAKGVLFFGCAGTAPMALLLLGGRRADPRRGGGCLATVPHGPLSGSYVIHSGLSRVPNARQRAQGGGGAADHPGTT